MADRAWLPELLPCDWNEYAATIERAYAVFLRDFGDEKSRPTFQSRRLGLKRHPEFEGKSATFWHFVTEGAVEASRTPVRERIERIAWPRALILEAGQQDSRVRVWCTTRNHAKRWVLALDDFSYLVVLDDREAYLLPWTAFTVDQDHRRAKLENECVAWQAIQKG